MPELAVVTVLDRERVARLGREKTLDVSTRMTLVTAQPDNNTRDVHEAKSPSPCAMRALSSRLCLWSKPCPALIMRSVPNWQDKVEAVDGLGWTILNLER